MLNNKMPKRLITPIYTMFSLGTIMAIAHLAKPTRVNNTVPVKSPIKQCKYIFNIRRV